MGPIPLGACHPTAFPSGFEGGETLKDIEVSLPLELRNRVTHFAVEGRTHAAARSLLADRLLSL